MLNKFKSRHLTSLILVISLVLSFSTSSFAFFGDYTSKATEQYIVNGETFDVSISKDGNVHTAVILENDGKTTTVIKVDKETGVVTYNGVTIHEKLISTNVLTERNLLLASESNWSNPTSNVYSLSLLGWGIPAIATLLSIKYGVPLSDAMGIAQIVIGAGGFLYVKESTQYNLVDYAPKVGYRITNSLHLTRDATGKSLFTSTVSGTR